jgi:hypothetical protein
MGRELFDYAFKEYARRWAFKHPTPADFFRTMEDASGVDLDWFWRGWFYGIEPVDIKLDTVKWFQVDMENDPEPIERTFPQRREEPFRSISQIRNAEDTSIQFLTEEDPDVVDFYTNYKPWETEDSLQQVKVTFFDETYKKKEKEEMFGGKNYYELTFVNEGGLPMPLIVEFTFEDGTKEIDRIPVEIWRKNENKVTKVFVKDKVATDIRLDPYRETADIDLSDNSWPVQDIKEPSRFQVFKSQYSQEETMNPMQKAIKAGKLDKDGKIIKP